jgi:Glyoxalase-like domain
MLHLKVRHTMRAVTQAGSAMADHIVVVVSDVEAAARRMRDRYGLGAVQGGRHDGGTANWVIPLANSQYVELLYAWDRDRIEADPEARATFDRLAREGDFIETWAVRTDDIDGVGRAFGIEPVAGRAVREDGTVSSWRIVAFDGRSNALPFFIGYDGAEMRAAQWAQRYAEAAHARPVGEILAMTLGGPEDPAAVLAKVGATLTIDWRPERDGIVALAIDMDPTPIVVTARD